MEMQAPDLGIPFHPSKDKLEKISQERSKIICDFLKEKKFTLLSPTPAKLAADLAKRMCEQGRFAGLVVSPLTSNPPSSAGRQQSAISCYFFKFPLGGKTARTLAFREAKILRFLNTHFLIISNLQSPISNFQPLIVKTPFGWALLSEYYQGPTLDKWLEKASKSAQEKMAKKVLKVLNRMTIVLDSNTPCFLFKKTAIHSWSDYSREVSRRLAEHPEFPENLKKRILKYINSQEKTVKKYQGKFVFSHRDFFGKNIIVQPDERLAVVDFEHAAIVKNYLLGLNFDLANIIVQSYQYPIFQKSLLFSHQASGIRRQASWFFSLNLCLIIQCLAKIAPVAQKMTPGGYQETLSLLKKIVSSKKSKFSIETALE